MPAIAAADMTIVRRLAFYARPVSGTAKPSHALASPNAGQNCGFSSTGLVICIQVTTSIQHIRWRKVQASELPYSCDTRGCPPSSSMHRLILGMSVFLSGFMFELTIGPKTHVRAVSDISYPGVLPGSTTLRDSAGTTDFVRPVGETPGFFRQVADAQKLHRCDLTA
ncbi:uncharacterized protein EDB93DRAFT_1119861 [Suillus bovinus]|uniref:uncharacterized protein n=1 Tax=Suillus bovinus TaxID=48563 RepID=UPI001B87140A|nr:uncharacterized protein EDB93DRAFT_1119861 [Suillus bovinus]KAG2158693.1 hypothetical protein EDB93DRAFT_1119861 [Suillus bovinus]